MKNSFTFLVHGDAGVGKSRLLASGPPPVCILDLEGRSRYLPYPKISWDVEAEAPPTIEQMEAAGATHCVAVMTKFSVLELAYRWLATDKHGFRTVGVDSLTFAQKRFIDKLAGTSALQQQDWGEVLRTLENLVRDFCDLPLQQTNTVETVAFSVGSKSVDNKTIPLLQGALKDTAAYMYDAVGYMYNAPDQSGQLSRNLLLQPQGGIVAKDNTDRLGGPVITQPDLSQLVARLSEEA